MVFHNQEIILPCAQEDPLAYSNASWCLHERCCRDCSVSPFTSERNWTRKMIADMLMVLMI